MMTIFLTFTLTVAGLWFVYRANQAYARIPTCRYREINVLVKQADFYASGYFLLGIASLALYPVGLVSAVLVFGYAFYRRWH